MGVRKPDPEAMIASLTVPGDGWRRDRVCFQNGPRRPFEGLISPDGLAWEAHEAPTSPRALRDHAVQLQANGYGVALVTVGGVRYLAERFRDNLKPWDGLNLGEWSDDLSGIPSQCVARGAFRGVRVALYLRWYGDPWAGHVVRCDGGGHDEFLYRHPWSPNLLPTDRPDPARESRGLLDMLSSTYDPWIPEIELGKAKRVLTERADAWLCEHLDDEAAWSVVLGGTPFRARS